MRELAEDLRAMAMSGLRQTAIAGDAIVRGHDDFRRIAEAGFVKTRGLGDDQPGAAARAGLVIGDEGIRRQALFG